MTEKRPTRVYSLKYHITLYVSCKHARGARDVYLYAVSWKSPLLYDQKTFSYGDSRRKVDDKLTLLRSQRVFIIIFTFQISIHNTLLINTVFICIKHGYGWMPLQKLPAGSPLWGRRYGFNGPVPGKIICKSIVVICIILCFKTTIIRCAITAMSDWKSSWLTWC